VSPIESALQQAQGCVEHGSAEEKTVEAVQNAAVRGKQRSEVLEASTSFERREREITEVSAHSDQDGECGSPREPERHERLEEPRADQTGQESADGSLQRFAGADRLKPWPAPEQLASDLRERVHEYDDEVEEDGLSGVGVPKLAQKHRQHAGDENREQRRRDALPGVDRLEQEYGKAEESEQGRAEDPERRALAGSRQNEGGGRQVRDELVGPRMPPVSLRDEHLAARRERKRGQTQAKPPATQPEQDQEAVHHEVVDAELERQLSARRPGQFPDAQHNERASHQYERGIQPEKDFAKQRRTERHRAEVTPVLTRFAAPRDAVRLAESLVGGKTRNLGRMVELGLPVPPWFCITTIVYANVLRDLEQSFATQLAGLDFADPAAVRAAALRIQREIRERSLSRTDERELLTRFDTTFGPGSRVAVRSSAVGEDSSSDSFAGQMDSFLFVTRSDLTDRVLACFASAYSERALRYRQARNRSNAGARVAVIVQQMIDSRVSGILFTRDPTAADSARAMVSAAFGLGEGIVSGKVESDTFLVNLASGDVISSQICEKKSRVVFDAALGRGTALEDVPAVEQGVSTLTPDSLREIVDTGRRLEASFGAPQDIEWTLDQAGSLYLLQARPITTLPSGRETIFDNANIVESFPGLSLPLTFSFARAAYEIVLVEASRRYGVPEELLARCRPSLHANLVALIHGRMYYNLHNWYRLIEILPGCEWMLPGWEEALGITPIVTRRRAKRSLPQHLALAFGMTRVGVRFIRELFVLDRDVARMLRLVQEALADPSARDLAALDAHTLLELSESLMSALFKPYAIQNSNDDAAQQFFALLGRLIERWRLGGEDLRNDLVAGETGLESLEPVRSLLTLTAEVRKVPRLRSLFEEAQSNAALWESLGRDADPAVSAFLRLAARHIELFGDRVLRELKLETPTLAANPAALVAMIRSHLQAGSNIEVVEGRRREMRKGAERSVRKRLLPHPIRRWIFGFALSQTRRTVKNREALRLARSRAVGIFKRIFRQIGCRFVEQGLIGNQQDLFYLTLEEIEAAIRGANVTRDLQELIALRKRDYEQYETETSASRINTRGIVQATPLGGRSTASSASGADGRPGSVKDELHGIGCSSGKVAARAVIVLDPRDDLEVRGRILVTQTTDPGWVFLMVTAAGLVAEKGSPLSHTAIIGRELGIPTIVGVADATRRIGDGENLEMDGRTGTLRRLPD